ncbi:hypothetical protein H9Q13_13290 [Pontibacter sp. JH31]|uniref:Uncharacterized protein n=1 Tax=Pontibacter aquaedesilientis TaxID=2766980 RepID=A0ABR7XKI1_9BACT|nr:hypothetical protein [Pontibacter aquaedesilientis]MBD1398143.1 hypothetical protein [Pontibacter aquaedesilientis]
MKWIELKQAVIGSGAIYLFGCDANETAYQFKRKIKKQRPNVIFLHAGSVGQIKEYQAAHWVKGYGPGVFHNYMTEGYRKNILNTALQCLTSTLQHFEREHGYAPAEVVLVRA